MTTETTTDSPHWVHRLGTVFASLTITALLFYVGFSLRVLWVLDGTWRIEDVGQDGLMWLLISVLAALIFVPAAYAVIGGLRRLGVRDRYAWPSVGVASIALLIGLVLLVADSAENAGNATTVDTLGILAILVSFGAVIAVGTWAGSAVTRIETPLQNRRLLAVGAILLALVVAPTAIAMAVEEPEPDTFDPETDGEYQDDPAWNESDSDLDETNETVGNESSDGSDEIVSTTTTLDALACDGDVDTDLPADTDAQSLNISNVSVWHNPDPTFYPGYELNIDDSELPGDVTGASATTNQTTNRTAAAAITGDDINVRTDGGPTRIWLDTISGERYEVTVCPGAIES